MKANHDFTIDPDDLDALYACTRRAYQGKSYDFWVAESKRAYSQYAKGRRYPKSYREWINAQIIAMTGW